MLLNEVCFSVNRAEGAEETLRGGERVVGLYEVDMGGVDCFVFGKEGGGWGLGAVFGG